MLDFLESAFTGHGQNARAGQEEQIKQIAHMALQALKLANPQLLRQLAFQGATQGASQGALLGGLAGTGESARKSRINRFGASVDDQVAGGMKRSALAAKEQGLGSGGALGDFGNLAQEGAKAKNRFMADQYSPENYAGDANSVFNLFQGQNASQGGMTGLYQLLSGIVNGQQPVSVQPGLGGALGGLLGGTDWSKAFK